MEPRMLVFVGSYAEADAPGVYVYSFDEKTETLTKLDDVSGLKNPTYVNVDMNHQMLYAIAENATEDGKKIGERIVAAFSKDSTIRPEMILWTDGNKIYMVESTSFSHALIFEKKFPNV